MVNRMNNNRMYCNNGALQNARLSTPQNPCPEAVKRLKYKLQTIDFSLVDTVLYLDAYPDCHRAKAKYNELLGQRSEILAKLAEAGVPMNNLSVLTEGWSWTDGPWPWEYDANI